MHTLVTDFSVAEVPEPVPAVVDQISVVRLLTCRPKPDIEVNVFGRLFNRLKADAPPCLGGVGFGYQQFAVFTAGDSGDLLRPVTARPVLRTVLNYPLILLRP